MTEWGIPFDVIEDNWTDREFVTMVDRLRERRHAEATAQRREARRAQERGQRYAY